MAGNGGARPGAGRPKGGKNRESIDREKKLAEAAERMAAGGTLTPEQINALSPLDVMLHAMKIDVAAGEWRSAASLAEKAAPYLHPKLASEVLTLRKAPQTIEGALLEIENDVELSRSYQNLVSSSINGDE